MAVTGEEYVLLNLLEVLLSLRAPKRIAAARRFCGPATAARSTTFPAWSTRRRSRAEGPAEELVDTGIQRLLGDLDELPHARPRLSAARTAQQRRDARPHGARRPRRSASTARSSSIVLTIGCKFRCSYCPIPAYNQRQHRVEERRADRRRDGARSRGRTASATSSAPTTTSSTTPTRRSRSPKRSPHAPAGRTRRTARSAGAPKRPCTTRSACRSICR